MAAVPRHFFGRGTYRRQPINFFDTLIFRLYYTTPFDL